MQDLTSKLFIGFIIPGFDEENKTGRYLVNIPELMSNLDPETEGVFCYNALNNLQINTFQEKYPNGPVGHSKKSNILSEVGEYKPLQSGVKYLIQFIANDINSGHIIRPAPFDIDYKLEKQVKELKKNPTQKKREEVYDELGEYGFNFSDLTWTDLFGVSTGLIDIFDDVIGGVIDGVTDNILIIDDDDVSQSPIVVNDGPSVDEIVAQFGGPISIEYTVSVIGPDTSGIDYGDRWNPNNPAHVKDQANAIKENDASLYIMSNGTRSMLSNEEYVIKGQQSVLNNGISRGELDENGMPI